MQTEPLSTPKRLNRINIGLIFSILIVIVFFLFVGNLIKRISETPHRKTIQTVSEEYLGLFKKKDVCQLKNPFTDISDGYPVSNLDYRDKYRAANNDLYKDQYSIVIWKSKIRKDYALANIFKESHNSADIELDTGYLTPSDFKYSFCYRPIKLQISKVGINLDGDSIRLIAKNDSVINYSLVMRSVSIKFNNSKNKDLLIMPKNGQIPASLLFLKRGDFLYLVFMSINYDNTALNDRFLYNLIKFN